MNEIQRKSGMRGMQARQIGKSEKYVPWESQNPFHHEISRNPRNPGIHGFDDDGRWVPTSLLSNRVLAKSALIGLVTLVEGSTG